MYISFLQSENWNGRRAVGIIYFSFNKVFNTVSPNTHVSKLGRYGRIEHTIGKKNGWRVSPRGSWLMGCALPASQ